MSFVKIVSFVVIEKKDQEAVAKRLNEAIDGLVISRIPVFDSGMRTISVSHVANASAVMEEIRKDSKDG